MNLHGTLFREGLEGVSDLAIPFAGEIFLADLSGALMHPASNTLIVADLHFEKGSFFAERRQHLPPYDTAATLAKLQRALIRHKPSRLIALGDSFHDKRAGERIDSSHSHEIALLGAGRELVWITGNHDPVLPKGLPGVVLASLPLGSITLRHEPLGKGPEMAGHLHPVARIATSAGLLRRRCFAQGERSFILPAFGSFAGGLNIHNKAFLDIYDGTVPRPHVLGDRKVFSVPASRTRPD